MLRRLLSSACVEPLTGVRSKMPVVKGRVGEKPVDVLRDTGCSGIGPYHSMSKQKILPIEPLIQCEAGRAKTMQRQSLYSPRTPKWPPSDKGEL